MESKQLLKLVKTENRKEKSTSLLALVHSDEEGRMTSEKSRANKEGGKRLPFNISPEEIGTRADRQVEKNGGEYRIRTDHLFTASEAL